MNRIARNIDGERVDILNATKEERYHCELCGGELIPKQGTINQWHYAHKTVGDCDSWHEMTPWHSDWQEEFYEEYREVVVESDGEKHRADIKMANKVIEFQSYYLSPGVFFRRMDFYSKDNMFIWVFDVRDKDIEKRYNKKGCTEQFIWLHAPKFGGVDWYEMRADNRTGLFLFLQISDDELVEVWWNKQGFKYFGGRTYSKREFINWFNMRRYSNEHILHQ